MDLLGGYFRQREESELDETKGGRQWYVPLHPVINPHKPEKVKRVCNVDAKYKGGSLNDKLFTGPDLLQILVGIIFRVREHQVVLTVDIEAMFLQLKMPLKEWRVLRFL